MIRYSIVVFTTVFILSGCSTKEINGGVDSITSDITKAFEDSKDKSSE